MSETTCFPHNYTCQAYVELNGVHYALLRRNGEVWRLGSSEPGWREAIAAGKAAGGVFLERKANQASRLALMCCGLGSVWPGMGRALYENFPIARLAMEELAALANWDILGLMAENSLDKVSQTRWQIPYLFMLEYAQWRLFHTLGLKPALISGHSLGELVALCLAGVYDLRTAWYLLDTRAEHMAELEAKPGRQGGMLAVPAAWGQIEPIISQWPELRVANRNTNRQYIIGGPIGQLREARKQLRRAKIPAILLNMNLAFHNPAMRILRDISLLRLASLTMGRGDFPVLSCVDACFYPSGQRDICVRIADLDENTVDWAANVEKMRGECGITHCLELGPQETLCGLVGEIDPDCRCLSADSKGHEAETTRQTLAALFAAGFLDFASIAQQAGKAYPEPAISFAAAAEAQSNLDGVSQADQEIVIALLAEAGHMPVEDIKPDSDLRRDLGLRSSTFPFLVLEAEQKLGRQIALETLIPLTTVADAMRFLAGAPLGPSVGGNGNIACSQPNEDPLCRYFLVDGQLEAAPLDPAYAALPKYGIIIFSPYSPLLQDAISAFTDFGISIDTSLRTCCQKNYFVEALAKGASRNPAAIVLDMSGGEEQGNVVSAALPALADNLPKTSLLLLINFVDENEMPLWLHKIASQLDCYNLNWRAVTIVDSGKAPLAAAELANMLENEIWHGAGKAVIWQRRRDAGDSFFCKASRFFDFVYPSEIEAAKPGCFEGYCQFSRFAEPALSAHGGGDFSPVDEAFKAAPWLPLSRLIDAIITAGSIIDANTNLIGLTDLRFYCFPALPDGITRLCQAKACVGGRPPLYQTPARLCEVALDVAELTPTGRQNEKWRPLAKGVCIGARHYPPLEYPWEHWGQAKEPVSPENSDISAFYQALGFGRQWQFIEHVVLSKDICLLELSLQDTGNAAWSVGLLLEAAMQAAMFMIASADMEKMANFLARWRFAAIGLVRFVKDIEISENARLAMRLSWRDEYLLRFDGQVMDSGNNMILAFHNLEFDSAL